MDEVPMVAAFAFAVLIQAGPVQPAVSPDSLAALWRDATRAQTQYERLSRQLAPITYSASRSGECDERVGRFCINFSPRGYKPELPEEPARVTAARQDVIEAFRRLVSVAPADSAAAAQLIRYLIEDDRATEAIPVARTFAWASGNSVWSAMLLGFAHQATGEDDAAEEHFVRALEALTPEERAEYESIELLLAGGERSVYRRMEASERVEYEAAVWRIADPLLLTPGNEAWTDHMARHVWIELLSRSPRVNGTVSWGSDLRELTLRYGVPVSRERIPAAFVWDSEIHMLERYSPDQLWYVPAELRSRGLPQRPDPGEPWHLDEPAARSGHTPRAFTLVDLPHQVTRFPFGDSILVRVDGWVRADTAAERAEIATGLFMLFDESHEVAYRALRDTAVAAGDSIVMTLWATMPPGDYVYSIEALDAAAGQGARARYPVTLPAPTPGQLTLSDILVTRPLPEDRTPESRTDPAIVPRPRLDLPVGASIGIYAEAHSLHASANGLARYSVELALEPDRRGIPVIRWFGNLLGLGGDTETGVRWTAEAPGDDPAIIAVNLALHDLDRGLYTVRLTVRDLVSGDVAESTRRIRLR